MRTRRRINLLLTLFLLTFVSSILAADETSLAESEPDSFAVPESIQSVLSSYCADCHDAEVQKGKVNFDALTSLKREARLELLNKAQEQLFLRQMPPGDSEQPTERESSLLTHWIRSELRRFDASKLEEKLRYPAYGNFVPHDRLFDGTVRDKAYTPARRWLVSPQIFHERVMDVFKLEGRDRDSLKHGSFVGVTNPFLLPDRSGVRYYDLDKLDGGHLLVMLGNAKWIADRQLKIAQQLIVRDRRKIQFDNPKDRWLPRRPAPSYATFQRIVAGDGVPSKEDLIEAVREQFDCVLRRLPSEVELNEYLELLRSSIELGGNKNGLRQMLVAVLLESEFLYRLELGESEKDADGRSKLSPREASYAISYSLGDRGPDPALIQAANDGRLTTREDYEREVRRLLDNEQYYRGQIDPTLNGKHYRSNETSHPKVIRFFREFFGYPGSLKVFKDAKRSGGKYRNPGRGTQASPGWLTFEADRIVTWHVEKDDRVFENLLTSDRFFVYHDKDNKTGRRIIEEWRGVYERLKDSNWRTEPERVLDDNLEFLKTQKSMRVQDNSRPGELVNYMHYFEESFGQGRTPFTTIPWAHGYTFHHSPFYSLPPTPSIGRYGSWKSTKFQSKVEKKAFWDYPPEQPFRIENRKGILTHPAWLIAHSTNFHSDPIRRGRWIREKLLAGRVPDVPITVDAQVPETADQTLRQRVEKVTAPSECWKCHKHMNPLGLAFEMYDDFGRFRIEEVLEHPDNLIKSGNGKTTFDVYPTAPIVTTGELTGTGDPKLDGDVENAVDMIDRLARSARVRQSIIRYAFRFFLGRNEMLSDSRTLIDADKAYVESRGSFRAVIISLLTSDSFIYRKATKD